MLVSVAIPAYNQADYLRIAIESALAQTHRPLEIIVVDDGSSDHTAEVCLSYRGEINYIYQDNDGTKGGGARNRAIREATGEWIALLDQDDLWMPNKIEKQVEIATTRQNLGAIFTQADCIGPNGQRLDEVAFRGKSGHVYHSVLADNPFCASSAMFRRSVLDNSGYPDPDTVSDWDLWLRITRDYEVYTIEEPLTLYRVHVEGFSAQRVEMYDRVLRLMRRQLERGHSQCAECGRIVTDYERVILRHKARCNLDMFHKAILTDGWDNARHHLIQAYHCCPRVVLKPRNLVAVVMKMIRFPQLYN